MDYIRVTKENLDREHICCAISNNTDVQVASKKAWLAERFDEGLVFLKSVERGKCFIEYLPAEYAWNPICADGYCTSTVCGSPARSRGTGTPPTCFLPASTTEKSRAGRVCASSPRRRKSPFSPTRSF